MDDVRYSLYRSHESSVRIWRKRSRYKSAFNQMAFLLGKWSRRNRISSVLNTWQSRKSEVLQTKIHIESTETGHISVECVSYYTSGCRFGNLTMPCTRINTVQYPTSGQVCISSIQRFRTYSCLKTFTKNFNNTNSDVVNGDFKTSTCTFVQAS